MSFFHSLLYGSGSSEDSATLGLQYLQDNSHFFYDGTLSTTADDVSMPSNDPGLLDQGPNGYHLTTTNGVGRTLSVNGVTMHSFKDQSTLTYKMPVNGSTIFTNSKFRLIIQTETQDGITTTVQNIFGSIIPTDLGINIWFSAAGRLVITMGNSSGVFGWQTTNVVRTNAVVGISLWEIEVDFDADTVRMWNEGYEHACSQYTGTIATYDHTIWPAVGNLWIGTINNNGSAVTHTTESSIFGIACIPQPTEQQERNVRDYFYSKLNVLNEVHIEDAADITTLRNSLRTGVFGSTTLPTQAPTASVVPYVGATLHILTKADITGFSSWDRHTFTQNDAGGNTWTHYVFHGHSSTPNGKLIVACQGHDSEPPDATESLFSQLGAAGYDIMWAAAPVCGSNVTANAAITLTSANGHGQMLAAGLDDELYLYFFDKHAGLTYLMSQSGYTEAYGGVGLSGGGWMITLISAMDERIKRTVNCRGASPRTYKDNSVTHIESDMEQGGSLFTSTNCGATLYALYTNHTYLDMFIMGTSSGRKVKALYHKQDSCCHRGDFVYAWEDDIAALCTSITGGSFDARLDTISGNLTHEYSSLDKSDILTFFST